MKILSLYMFTYQPRTATRCFVIIVVVVVVVVVVFGGNFFAFPLKIDLLRTTAKKFVGGEDLFYTHTSTQLASPS